jgi:hypothetical protein
MAQGHIENKRQYRALKRKGMSKSRAAAIANSPGASKRGGERSHKKARSPSSRAKQGSTRAQKKAAGRKGGRARSNSRSR